MILSRRRRRERDEFRARLASDSELRARVAKKLRALEIEAELLAARRRGALNR